MPKKTLLITLLIVILTASLAATALYIKNKATQSQKESTISPFVEPEEIALETTPTEPSEIDTSDWKTYRSEELSIAFKYPKNWMWWKIIKPEGNPFRYLGPFYNSEYTWVNFVKKNRSELLKNNFENYCDEYIDFPFVEPDTVVSCNKIKIKSSQEGLLRDGIMCSVGLPGGSPECEFQRTFIININNQEYPLLIAGKRWGHECFMERCYSYITSSNYENMVTCMKTEYGNCKAKNKIALKIFNEFIKEINIW